MALATITNINCPSYFDSSKDNTLVAEVGINNSSELAHSCQVIFRGYIRKGEKLHYEFLHEQQWILVNPQSDTIHKVIIDVWLPRFPPSMTLPDGSQIEYSVRASIDPWFENKYTEKFFEIRRTLILKMPHVLCFPLENNVSKCCEHGSILHRKCDPINGTIIIEKGAFAVNEYINITWNLNTHVSKIDSYHCKLLQLIEIRESDPGNFMSTKEFKKVVQEEKCKENQTSISLLVPPNCNITIPMSLWDVLAIRYELHLEIKIAKRKEPVVFHNPIVICSEEITKRKRPTKVDTFFRRIQDIDDDSEDDDDYDSESEKENTPVRENTNYSVDIENVVANAGINKHKQLENAKAEVSFIMNSADPQPVRNLRLLLTGEARVGGTWYEFVRFKAIANSNPKSLLSPGEHKLTFQLPFSESQYDTTILPPTIGDEIKYIIRATTESIRKNVFFKDCELIVDRFVDTWAKEAFKTPHLEEYGSTKIHMSQRCFKRGKWVVVTIDAPEGKYLHGKLVQQQRLRLAGFKLDDSYCTERNIITKEEKIEKKRHVHISQIPYDIPPSIEISYWNILQVMYCYELQIMFDGGHSHTHSIPIWIGCTEDNVEIPTMPQDIEEEEKQIEEALDDLPEFEVVLPEVQEHPYWVERFNNNTYYDT